MRLSDKTYDTLRWIQKIFVLLATFYDDLAGIWGLPYGDKISRTCLSIAAILLGILEIASVTYNKEQNISLEMEDDEIAEHEVEEEVG